MKRFHLKSDQRLTIVIVIMGFMLSGLSAWHAEKNARRTDYQRFLTLSERINGEISRRIRQFEYGLRGARSLFAANEQVTRASFTAMVQDRNLDKEFHGALGLGFIRYVPKDEVEEFLQKTRADGDPDFAIHPPVGDVDCYVIEYIIPEDVNRVAIGYNMASEERRRDAAERAMRTGEAALTAPLTLLQREDEGSGFIMYYPVYEKGKSQATEEDRRRHIIGWTYMPLIAREILDGVSQQAEEQLDFEVFHGRVAARERLIYDDDGHLLKTSDHVLTREDYAQRLFHLQKNVSIGGETWTIACSTNDNFRGEARTDVAFSLIGGASVTLLLAGIIRSISRSNERAQELAEKITSELATTAKKAEMLAMVATRSTNAVVICDKARKITWVNEGFTRVTGYEFDEVIGKKPGEILQSELSDPRTIEEIRRHCDEGTAYQCEILNRTKLGRDYWVHCDIIPLLNAQQEITGFMSIQLDVTERRRADELLKEQVERTELALAAGELALWDWNVATGETLFDKRWAAMFGERMEDLRSHVDEWISRCHPDDLPIAQEALKQHFEGKTEIYQCRHRMRHKDGNWRWVMARGKVVSFGPNGEPLRVVGTQRDVTRQYIAQLEIDRQSSALIHTGKIARVGAWELNLIDNSLYWSDQIRLIHEVDQDYVPTLESALNFYPDEAKEAISHALQHAIATGEPFEVEMPLVTAKGRRIWVRSMGEAFRVDGRVQLIKGAFQDITEMHQQKMDLEVAKIAAEKATQAKADFLANMSHEIRTPMNAVIGMSELLQNTSLNAEQADFVNVIRNSGETLLSLINDILDFSKIEFGGVQLEHIPIDLRECVESSIDFVARPAAEKGLELLVLFEPDAPTTIYGDKTRMSQIITNLLSNAVKFTDKGEIFVTVSQTENDLLHIAVSDTGIGIPADRLDRLFKSFSQVDTSTTRQYGGTGLGLAICSRLVKVMEGSIWVDSVEGKGSTFHIEIPFQFAPPPEESKTFLNSQRTRGKRVLIVDENPKTRQILSMQTQGWGLVPVTVETAEEALLRLERGEVFDLAVLDIQRSFQGVEDPATKMRQSKGAELLPIIALTSLRDAAHYKSRLHVSKVLTKPVKSALFYESILQALHIKESRNKSQAPSALDHKMAHEYPLTILLVEDTPINQRVAQLLLAKLGYTAEVAENGVEALAALEKKNYDVVFMDVQMPEMDGIVCTSMICQKYPLIDRPWIIAMTANAQEGDSEACIEAGMDDYLSKPISAKAIANALVRASEEMRKRRTGV